MSSGDLATTPLITAAVVLACGISVLATASGGVCQDAAVETFAATAAAKTKKKGNADKVKVEFLKIQSRADDPYFRLRQPGNISLSELVLGTTKADLNQSRKRCLRGDLTIGNDSCVDKTPDGNWTHMWYKYQRPSWRSRFMLRKPDKPGMQCLGVYQDSRKDGSYIPVLKPCDAKDPTQMWYPKVNDRKTFPAVKQIKNHGTGMCMEDRGNELRLKPCELLDRDTRMVHNNQGFVLDTQSAPYSGVSV